MKDLKEVKAMSEENQEVDILKQLGVKDIGKQNANKFYKFAIYGKFGTGKTTFLTKDENALVLDINEDGTTVASNGVVSIANYNHFATVVKTYHSLLSD